MHGVAESEESKKGQHKVCKEKQHAVQQNHEQRKNATPGQASRQAISIKEHARIKKKGKKKDHKLIISRQKVVKI